MLNNSRNCKVIFLLISTGAAEIVLVLLSLIYSTPLPLLPIQLLWLNLVTNGIQDVALAFEPAEGNELKQRPRSPNEPIFNRLMIDMQNFLVSIKLFEVIDAPVFGTGPIFGSTFQYSQFSAGNHKVSAQL